MTIPTISTLPVAPARTDAPATFVTRADAFLAAMVVMQGELNTSIGAMNTDIAQANTDATNAAASASAAAASATAAANAAGAALWVSGQAYAQGDAVISPINFQTYRAETATSGTTDPSLDANWTAISGTFPDQTGNSGKFLTTDGTDPSWAELTTDPTLATLTKTFSLNETATMTLSSALSAGVPIVSATKEIPQTGVSNNNWDAAAGSYELEDTAYATTLDFTGGASPFVLGTGSFASADVGKTIEANSGVFVLTATDGSFVETTAPISYDQVASGDWSMTSLAYDSSADLLKISNFVEPDFTSAAFIDSFSVALQTTTPYGF